MNWLVFSGTLFCECSPLGQGGVALLLCLFDALFRSTDARANLRIPTPQRHSNAEAALPHARGVGGRRRSRERFRFSMKILRFLVSGVSQMDGAVPSFDNF